MKTVEARLGQRIARQRHAVGLTQAQLAEAVDVQPETVSRMENGSRSPSLGLLVRVAVALDVELHELVRLPDISNPKTLALDRLSWFASRLSPAEIDLVLEVGSAVLDHMRLWPGLRTEGTGLHTPLGHP